MGGDGADVGARVTIADELVRSGDGACAEPELPCDAGERVSIADELLRRGDKWFGVIESPKVDVDADVW